MQSGSFFPVPEGPESPITYLIKTLSEFCQIDYEHAIFEIEEYCKRNDVAHSGIDNLVGEGHWCEVASLLVRDTQAVDLGILPKDMELLKDDLLKTLKIFESRYFASISVKTDPVTDIRKVISYKTSVEELERQEAAVNARAAG